MKKLTYSYVKDYIKSFGYILISLEYKNVHSKLLVRCPLGHEYKVTFNNFKKRGCKKCQYINIANRQKFTYEYVKSYIESFDYVLLSKAYTNNQTKLLIRCSLGHEYKATFNKFKQGGRCSVCFGKQKLTYSYVKNYVESFDYTLLSLEYRNAHSKLLVRCSLGHEYEVKFNNFQQGQRCPYCAGNVKFTYSYVKNYIESFDYTLLSVIYINCETKLRVKCPLGHEYKIDFFHFQNRDQRCPECSKRVSKGEQEVKDYIKYMKYDIIGNDRTQIFNPLTERNLELDIWIPYLNKAIEYNGAYWHSNNYQKIKDKIKVEQCKQKNIDLLVIKEYDWLNNKENEEQKIIKFLNKRT